MAAPVLQVKRGALSNLPALRAGEPAFTTDSFDFYVGIDSTTNNNKFLGSYRYWTKETTSVGSSVKLVEGTSNGTNSIALKAPNSIASDLTYVLPGTQGGSNTVLTNDGSGNLSWSSGSFNATFTGITTFSDTTDSTTKDNGSIIVEGGIGIEKSVNIGGNLKVTGITTSTGGFVGNLTGNASSADQVKTVTASNTSANYYITFVDSHNGSATNETVYTDDGVYYNPGTNTFTTQHGYFTGNVTVDGTLTGTASTATRATLVDTTSTSSNADYYVTFVDTLAGQTGETLRVGVGLSVNPSTGAVGVSSTLSVGTVSNSYIKAGGGSNAMYLYTNGDVSFQAKVITNSIRSSSNASNTISISDLDATFGRDVKVTGITTTATLKLNGTSGIGITGISSSTTLVENSNSYLPTQAAVKAYVDAVDLTLGLNADTGGPSTVNTSQTLTISGTANEVETSVSGQTVTVGLPNSVTVTTALTTPTVKATNLQANDGTTAITITNTTGAVGFANSVTISGDLYVLGNTTEVNTTSLKVEDTLVDLGLINSGGVLVAPTSDLNLDLGVIFNWYNTSAKKASVFWDDSAQRIGIASDVTESSGVLTVSQWAAVEIGALWVNDCAGQSQVISCSGTERSLINITVDAGTF